jgi:hypothetical protein
MRLRAIATEGTRAIPRSRAARVITAFDLLAPLDADQTAGTLRGRVTVKQVSPGRERTRIVPP